METALTQELVSLGPRWIDLGEEVSVQADHVVALHRVTDADRVDYDLGPEYMGRRPRAAVITDKGIILPSYVTKETALRRLRGELPEPLSPLALDEMRGPLSELVRDVRATMQRDDLSDDAKRVCDVVLDRLAAILTP